MRELISSIRNFPRHLATAFINIWRNGVMSTAAIFTVTITMLLIGGFGLLAMNVNAISKNIEEGVQIYVKLERDIDSNAEQAVGTAIKGIKGVKKVTFSSKDEELNKLIKKQGKEGADLFESYRNDNPLGAAYTVEVTNPNNIAKIAKQIEKIANVNSVNYGGTATTSMVKTLQTVRNVGSVVIIALIVVALLVISTTIKMTIESRKTEIGIMRLVGASNWYIRLPFMLEGVLIGLFGSLIPILAVVYGYRVIYSYANGSFVTSALQLLEPMPLIKNVSLMILLLGVIVGGIGSGLSMRKFLKL